MSRPMDTTPFCCSLGPSKISGDRRMNRSSLSVIHSPSIPSSEREGKIASMNVCQIQCMQQLYLCMRTELDSSHDSKSSNIHSPLLLNKRSVLRGRRTGMVLRYSQYHSPHTQESFVVYHGERVRPRRTSRMVGDTIRLRLRTCDLHPPEADQCGVVVSMPFSNSRPLPLLKNLSRCIASVLVLCLS